MSDVSNIHDLPCVPHIETMQEVMQRLFANSGQAGMVEISWTARTAPHALSHGQLFDLADLDLATEHAARINADPNINVYLSAGLRRVGTYANARATDADVELVVACWADCDKPGSLEAAVIKLETIGMRPNLITYTGREPYERGQLWWILDEPTADLVLHRRLQRGLASLLSSDPSVINPSRVMRFIGSVAWPLKAGRSLEMTGIRDGEVRAEPYTVEELVEKLERAGMLATAEERTAERPPNVLDFNAAEPQHDLESLISEAAKPGQWHRHALLATAHLLGKGLPPDLVLTAITGRLQQPGYGYIDTRNELVVMMEGAMRRGMYRPFTPDPDAIAASEALYAQAGEPRPGYVEPARPASPFLTIDQLADAPPVEWMVENYLPCAGMSAIFAPPGAFKSFLALDIGLSVAYGLPWHGFATRQRKVLYIVAEGRGGFYRRIRIWQQHRAEGESTDQFVLLTAPVNLSNTADVEAFMDAIDEHLGGVGLVIVDTVARNYGPGDENSTKDMNAYVAGSTLLAERGAHVLHVHHAGKDGSKGERGSSAFLGALDTSLKLERETGSDVATLYVKKQKDGEEAKPLRLAFAVAEGAHIRTGECIESRIPTLAGEVTAPVYTAAVSGISKAQREILRLVASGVSSVTLLTAELKADKANVHRSLKRLQERGLVRQDENHFWHATDNKTDNGKAESNQGEDD